MEELPRPFKTIVHKYLLMYMYQFLKSKEQKNEFAEMIKRKIESEDIFEEHEIFILKFILEEFEKLGEELA